MAVGKQPATPEKPQTANLRRGGGRTGPNKLTRSVKEAFQIAFNELQSHPGAKLSEWAQANPTDFYKLASKLIPAEINGHMTHELDIGVLAKRPDPKE